MNWKHKLLSDMHWTPDILPDIFSRGRMWGGKCPSQSYISLPAPKSNVRVRSCETTVRKSHGKSQWASGRVDDVSTCIRHKTVKKTTRLQISPEARGRRCRQRCKLGKTRRFESSCWWGPTPVNKNVMFRPLSRCFIRVWPGPSFKLWNMSDAMEMGCSQLSSWF